MICSKAEPLSSESASSLLKKGEIVILPTDTVYGFSGIADLKGKTSFCTQETIARIKNRDFGKPLIMLIASPSDLSLYTDEVLPPVLAEKWPGSLTVIVPLKEDNPLDTSLKTAAFRCPGDEWLRSVIEKTGAPVYSTSVNRSGNPVLDHISDIKKEFSDDVPLIVDDGDKTGALPSTIVKLQNGSWTVIRQGSVIV
ncbi:MAG: L-threonylcarbamoyladenylate synthase [Treponema sp.]|nr:L-threonylcarbamoyladenylate synthase [Treponema sp.]